MASVSTRGVAFACLAVVASTGFVCLGAQPTQPLQARGPVTFTRDVAPILFTHCAGCHRPGEAGPFSLLSYDDARQRARLIADVTGRRVMPPWLPEPGVGEFEGARRLSPGEIEVLHQWVADGVLEGDQSDLPRAPVFTPGWQLGRPDLVVTMPAAYLAPADGADVFRNFVLPAPVKTRRWVEAVEVRPGNPRVVHHARVLLDQTGDSRRRDEADAAAGFDGMDPPAQLPAGRFIGWASGTMPARSPFAWPLEPGSDLIVQAHLKPSGRPEPVQVSIGLYFTDTPPTRAPVMLILGSQAIDIPAGADRYEVADSFTLPVDAQALRIYPHAHYLARDMTVTARMPDGSTRGLLHIADWDFNWQDDYAYAQPIDLPRGTVVTMRYVFDNSAANPRNPRTPPVRVRFGPAASDEMAELLLQLLPRRLEDEAVLRTAAEGAVLFTRARGEAARVAAEPDNYEARNNLGAHYFRLGRVGEAIAQFEAALAVAPGHASSHYNLGAIALAAGRFEEAAGRFERAIANRAGYVDAHVSLGVALERLGRPRDAEASYQKAIVSSPDHAVARYSLTRLLLRRGAASAAVAALQPLARIRPGDVAVLDLLAAAYAAEGDLVQAVRTANTALTHAIPSGNSDVIRSLRARVELYEGQLARREP